MEKSTANVSMWNVRCGSAGIPGSHKANVGLPAHYRKLDDYIDENVRPIGCRAGDCIIFTEALSESLCLESCFARSGHREGGLTPRVISFVAQRTELCRGHWRARRVLRSSTSLTPMAPPGHATTSTRRTLVRVYLYHDHHKVPTFKFVGCSQLTMKTWTKGSWQSSSRHTHATKMTASLVCSVSSQKCEWEKPM